MKPLKLLLAASLSLSIFFTAFGQASPAVGNSKTEANKDLIKKIYAELNKKNLALFDQYFATDVIDHSAFPGQAPGREGLKAVVKELFGGYPDINAQIVVMIADGDLVATREQWTATEIKSGAKKSGWTMHMFKIKNGMVQEEWSKGWEWLE
jgi:predicted SnoaL-like aldol condensation-catalyzing enzyme